MRRLVNCGGYTVSDRQPTLGTKHALLLVIDTAAQHGLYNACAV